jgi:hypothetical protein
MGEGEQGMGDGGWGMVYLPSCLLRKNKKEEKTFIIF